MKKRIFTKRAISFAIMVSMVLGIFGGIPLSGMAAETAVTNLLEDEQSRIPEDNAASREDILTFAQVPQNSSDGFLLAESGQGVANIYVDTNEKPGTLYLQPITSKYYKPYDKLVNVEVKDGKIELRGIGHAADNLATDIENITGERPLRRSRWDEEEVELDLPTYSSQISWNSDNPTAFLQGNTVIVGIIGQSPIVDALIANKYIDVSKVNGKWEAYTMALIKNDPEDATLVSILGNDIENALIIAGSDKRGAIFGIYKISETIGVSPWGFFADAKPLPQRKLVLFGDGRTSVVQDSPSVKYRGIFINDERQTDRWSYEWNPEGQSVWEPARIAVHDGAYRLDSTYYQYVFDMILRNYGNYLQPAMWHNVFWLDDPMNPIMADAYGVVMGQEHTSFLGAMDKEWGWGSEAYNWGSWTVLTNRDNLNNFWQNGVDRYIHQENVISVGMRGLSDTNAWGNVSRDARVEHLNKLIKDQIGLVENALKKSDDPRSAEELSYSLTLYGEMEAVYCDGLDIPPQVTIILANDSQQMTRMLPTEKMREDRFYNGGGGFGVYYHFDYVGSPRNFRWINSIANEKTRQQMIQAYDYGVQEIWVVNAGNIKFNEQPLDYWFKLGYDVDAYRDPPNTRQSYNDFAGIHFGDDLAEEIGDILSTYTRINELRTPEWMSFHNFSLNYFNEAETLLNELIRVRDAAREIFNNDIAPDQKDAFYNLVMHPVNVSCNTWELMVNLQRNRLYARNGVTAANDYRQEVFDAVTQDSFWMHFTYGTPELMAAYQAGQIADLVNHTAPHGVGNVKYDGSGYVVADGKWYGYYVKRNHDAPHGEFYRPSESTSTNGRNHYYLGQNHTVNQINVSSGGWAPTLLSNIPSDAVMVVLPQSWNPEYTLPGAPTASSMMDLPAARTGSIDLYPFTNYENETRYIEIANAGQADYSYSITPSAPWIILEKNSGTITSSNKLERVNVRIDWDKVPAGASATGTLTVAGAGETVTVNVTANIFNEALAQKLPAKTFIETNGYVSILSNNFSKSVSASAPSLDIYNAGDPVSVQAKWTVLDNFGREGSAVKVEPSVLTARQQGFLMPGNSPYVEYNVYIATPGEINIVTQWTPTNSPDYTARPSDGPLYSQMRYGVSFGNDQPQLVDILPSRFAPRENNGGWSIGVETAVRTLVNSNAAEAYGGSAANNPTFNGVNNICASIHRVSEPGLYTLRIYMVHDSAVLEKILVGTEATQRVMVGPIGADAHFQKNITNIFTGPERGSSSTVSNTTRTSFLGPPQTFFTKADGSDTLLVVDSGIPAPAMPVAYTVIFDTNGGSKEANRAVATLPPANTVRLPNFLGGTSVPVRAGFTFNGWNTTPDGSGTEFTADTEVTGNMTVYAMWTPASRTVTFNLQGGNIGGSTTNPTRVVAAGLNSLAESELDLPATPSRTGYTFREWNTTTSGLGETFTANTSVDISVTIVAVWDPIPNEAAFTITYRDATARNANTITGSTAVTPSSFSTISASNLSASVPNYTYGVPVALPIPSKAGWRFVGWYASYTLEGDPISHVPVDQSGNVTYYANFVQDGASFRIYYVDGSERLTGLEPSSYVIGTGIAEGELPNAPDKTGCKFAGWFTDETYEIAVTNIPESAIWDQFLFAKYVPEQKSGVESISAVKTLVAGYAANVKITLTGSELSGLKATLFGKTANVVNGVAVLTFTADEVLPVGAYDIIVSDEADTEVIQTSIVVVPQPVNLWTPTAFTFEWEGINTVTIIFAAPVEINKAPVVGGVTVPTSAVTIYNNSEYGDYIDIITPVPGGQSVVVSGVRFPELFPSFSFTFSLDAAELTF